MHPAETYYRACLGRWRGPMQMTIDHLGALRDAMGWLNAVSFWLIAHWPLGTLWMETSVRRHPTDGFVHTTRPRWLIIPLMWSEEHIVFEGDDGEIRLTGRSRAIVMPWPARLIEGPGRINDDADEARYTLSWLGGVVHQVAERADDMVTLRQEGPGFNSVQPLRRQR